MHKTPLLATMTWHFSDSCAFSIEEGFVIVTAFKIKKCNTGSRSETHSIQIYD